jgi:DNA-binding PadR family transcriptional regulator
MAASVDSWYPRLGRVYAVLRYVREDESTHGLNGTRAFTTAHVAKREANSRNAAKLGYGNVWIRNGGPIEGRLKRGTVYVTLQRMEEKGFIDSRLEERTYPEIGIPRRVYRLTGAGQRVLEVYDMAHHAFCIGGGLRWQYTTMTTINSWDRRNRAITSDERS